jgi:hypothetical protein
LVLVGSSPVSFQRIPDVEIIWKFCGKRRLTGYKPHCMFVKFRGQSEMLSSVFAWTEFAPLRRIAIRSLTTRLNVPVVRSRFGHKSERSHKLDHHGLSLARAKAEWWRHPALLKPEQLLQAALDMRRWQPANYPSAGIRFQTRV